LGKLVYLAELRADAGAHCLEDARTDRLSDLLQRLAQRGRVRCERDLPLGSGFLAQKVHANPGLAGAGLTVDDDDDDDDRFPSGIPGVEGVVELLLDVVDDLPLLFTEWERFRILEDLACRLQDVLALLRRVVLEGLGNHASVDVIEVLLKECGERRVPAGVAGEQSVGVPLPGRLQRLERLCGGVVKVVGGLRGGFLRVEAFNVVLDYLRVAECLPYRMLDLAVARSDLGDPVVGGVPGSFAPLLQLDDEHAGQAVLVSGKDHVGTTVTVLRRVELQRNVDAGQFGIADHLGDPREAVLPGSFFSGVADALDSGLLLHHGPDQVIDGGGTGGVVEILGGIHVAGTVGHVGSLQHEIRATWRHVPVEACRGRLLDECRFISRSRSGT